MACAIRVSLAPVLPDLPFIGGIGLSILNEPYLDFDLRFVPHLDGVGEHRGVPRSPAEQVAAAPEQQSLSLYSVVYGCRGAIRTTKCDLKPVLEQCLFASTGTGLCHVTKHRRDMTLCGSWVQYQGFPAQPRHDVAPHSAVCHPQAHAWAGIGGGSGHRSLQLVRARSCTSNARSLESGASCCSLFLRSDLPCYVQGC